MTPSIVPPNRNNQRPFSMIPPRHNGLLHHLETNSSASSFNSTIIDGGSANITIVNVTQNGTYTSGNGTTQQQEQEHSGEQPRHRPIYYLSRAYQVIALTIVLALALHHLIIKIRHKKRIRKQLRRQGLRSGKGDHTRVPTEDPDEAASPIGRSSDTTFVDIPAPKHSVDDRLLSECPAEEGGSQGGRRGEGGYWFTAWEAVQRNWLYLGTLPGWLYGPETVADAIWTAVYTATLSGFALATIPCKLTDPFFPERPQLTRAVHEEFWYLYFANGLGVLVRPAPPSLNSR